MSDCKLKVFTSSYRYSGDDRLDITVKSGELAFAPSWGLVMNIKEGRITENQFREVYYQMMRHSYVHNRPRWDELLSMERVVLVCYCPEGQFCHRYLLAGILEKLGATYEGEK